ncbi:21995_t:CDS:1, partial [Racocetra persica]
MSDYELNNEINQEISCDFNFLSAKNKGKVKSTQATSNWHIHIELIDQLFSDDNEDN